MARLVLARLVLGATIVTLANLTAAEVAAAGSFDGSWNVVVVTGQGMGICEPHYRGVVRIVDGRLVGGGGTANFSGRVNSNGAVKVHITRFDGSARGSGRLSSSGSGGGVWSGHGNLGRCSGQWTAKRR